MEFLWTLMTGVAVVGILFAVLKWLETTLRDRHPSGEDRPSLPADDDRPDFVGHWSD